VKRQPRPWRVRLRARLTDKFATNVYTTGVQASKAAQDYRDAGWQALAYHKDNEQGWYCPKCGACYRTLGSGLIVCQKCGGAGLRGFDRPPMPTICPVTGCEWKGWDDGGINDDLGMHRRREHGEGRPVEMVAAKGESTE